MNPWKKWRSAEICARIFYNSASGPNKWQGKRLAPSKVRACLTQNYPRQGLPGGIMSAKEM